MNIILLRRNLDVGVGVAANVLRGHRVIGTRTHRALLCCQVPKAAGALRRHFANTPRRSRMTCAEMVL